MSEAALYVAAMLSVGWVFVVNPPPILKGLLLGVGLAFAYFAGEASP